MTQELEQAWLTWFHGSGGGEVRVFPDNREIVIRY